MDKFSPKKSLSRLNKGDVKAFEEIYSFYYNDLCRYTSNFTNDRLAAEDIVQDVLIKLWEIRTEINIHTSLKSYLYKACYFKFLEYYKKNRRINDKLETFRYNLINEIISEEESDDDLLIIKLRKAIDKLPKRCKEIFLLNKYEGYKQKEIAEYLGLSPKTVENQIGKAYIILKGLLKILIIYLHTC